MGGRLAPVSNQVLESKSSDTIIAKKQEEAIKEEVVFGKEVESYSAAENWVVVMGATAGEQDVAGCREPSLGVEFDRTAAGECSWEGCEGCRVKAKGFIKIEVRNREPHGFPAMGEKRGSCSFFDGEEGENGGKYKLREMADAVEVKVPLLPLHSRLF